MLTRTSYMHLAFRRKKRAGQTLAEIVTYTTVHSSRHATDDLHVLGVAHRSSYQVVCGVEWTSAVYARGVESLAC